MGLALPNQPACKGALATTNWPDHQQHHGGAGNDCLLDTTNRRGPLVISVVQKTLAEGIEDPKTAQNEAEAPQHLFLYDCSVCCTAQALHHTWRKQVSPALPEPFALLLEELAEPPAVWKALLPAEQWRLRT